LTVETVSRTGIGTVLGTPAEQHDRAVLAQPVSQRADDGGIADQLHDREIARRAMS
jgi:hypothetical protein